MGKLILIPVFLCLMGPLMALETPTEPLEPGFQKLLPSNAQLVRVQHLKLPGIAKAVMVTYGPREPRIWPEADAALLAYGEQGPYVAWKAEPVNSSPMPFSGIYYLGLSRPVPVFLFCHEFGASVGVHMEAYIWEDKTFKPLGCVPCDGYRTLEVVPIPGRENMVVLKGRYHYVEYLIYRKGRFAKAPGDYIKEYNSNHGITDPGPH